MRSVRATIDVVEKLEVLHNLSVCICCLSYPACNAHAPYCHLWLAPLYSVSLRYFIKGTIFEKKKGHRIKNVGFYFLYSISLKHLYF